MKRKDFIGAPHLKYQSGYYFKNDTTKLVMCLESKVYLDGRPVWNAFAYNKSAGDRNYFQVSEEYLDKDYYRVYEEQE